MLHLRYRGRDEKEVMDPQHQTFTVIGGVAEKKIHLPDEVQYRTILHERGILSPASQERRAVPDMIQVREFGAYRLSIVAYTRRWNPDSMPP